VQASVLSALQPGAWHAGMPPPVPRGGSGSNMPMSSTTTATGEGWVAAADAAAPPLAAGAAAGKKTALLRHLYIKCIILPRQARDKHRENSKKVPFSLRRW